MKVKKKTLVLFLAPAVIYFCIMFVYPIIRTIIMSFFKVEGVTDSISSWEFVGLSNYSKLFTTKLFGVAIANMAKIWLYGGIIVLVISLIFAAILTNGVSGKSFYRTVIYLPNIINAVAMATMWINYVYNKRFGLLHRFFTLIGANSLAKIDWMTGGPKFWALLIAFNFGSVGYYMLILMSGIDRIPRDIYEAATVDGANKVKQFFYITLPLLTGIIKTCLTFWTIGVVGFFVWSQMWSSPLPSETSTITPFVYMYTVTFATRGTTQRDGGLGAAVGVLMTIIVLITFLGVNKLLKKDDVEI